MERFDCQACGVCCCNTEANLRAFSAAYIEVTKDDRLYREDRARLKVLADRDGDGRWHMKLQGRDARCIGLEGELGYGVACTIYPWRPKVCKNVEAGDEECLKARRRFGLPLTRAADEARIDRDEGCGLDPFGPSDR